MPGSEHKDFTHAMQSVILPGSFVTLSPPWGPGNSMLHICFLVGSSGRKFNPLYFRYTFHCALGSTWATNHYCIWTLTLQVQSVILPLYVSLRVGIHVGYESPCHFKRAAKLEHVCYGIGATKTIEKMAVHRFSDFDNKISLPMPSAQCG